MELVTLKTFNTPVEAHILKSRLESEDIPCFLTDENMVGLNPLYNVTIGGVKLKINKEDAERALAIVREIENTPLTDDNDKVITCPKCGSSNITSDYTSIKSIKGVLALIVALLFSILPLYTKKVYKCKQCGNEFLKANK